jgi:hypothetical protein
MLFSLLLTPVLMFSVLVTHTSGVYTVFRDMFVIHQSLLAGVAAWLGEKNAE